MRLTTAAVASMCAAACYQAPPYPDGALTSDGAGGVDGAAIDVLEQNRASPRVDRVLRISRS